MTESKEGGVRVERVVRARHFYRVDLARNVRSPAFGPHAYYTDIRRGYFPFGKNQTYKTGELARVAAEAYAKTMFDQSSAVSIWRVNGCTAHGNYLKDDRGSRFAAPWANEP